MKKADEIMVELMGHVMTPTDIVIPNFYHGHYEMDLFKLTGSGWIIEYEIKVTRADFKKDFDKGFKYYQRPRTKKHEELLAGNLSNRFYFVSPPSVIELKDIPAKYGLLHYYNGRMHMVKSAGILHKRKYEDHKALLKRLTWRLFLREERLRRKAEYWAMKTKKEWEG